MSSPVPDTVSPERGFRGWVERTEDAAKLRRFRVVFGAIWLAYDVLDLALGGTRAYLWSEQDRIRVHALTAVQIASIACGVALVSGIRPRAAALAGAGLRALAASIFLVNDLVYAAITLLLLAHAETDRGVARAPVWPRTVLLIQTAWIYLATAVLKLNPSFLSGGDLYVRQQIVAANHAWRLPAIYRASIATLAGNAALARAAIGLEIALAGLLVYFTLGGSRRRWVGPAATALAAGIHGFAAVSNNVWFFGASMIAEIALLTR